MAEASLREYCNKAKELIETDALDESISLCQHILRWYPKHIEAYQLLGEACLERGDHYEAIDLFKRVLSANPENFISYVGLSIIYDSEGAINESIWQLERAFELAPGNSEVRKELQRLYGLSDGSAPRRLKLTRGALGRLYSKDELYPQAIDEYQYLLEGDPDRVDLQLAEAEALWRHGRTREAVESCQAVLAKLPNCLKANLILAKIWLENDLVSEAQPLLDVAQQLDAENRMAETLFGPDSPLKARTASLPEMHERPLEAEVEAELADTASTEELPDWMQSSQQGNDLSGGDVNCIPSAEEELPIAPWMQALREMVPDEDYETEESPREEDTPVQASPVEPPSTEAVELEADETTETVSDPTPQTKPIEDDATADEVPESQESNAIQPEELDESVVEVESPSWFEQIRPTFQDQIEQEASYESTEENSVLDQAIAKAYPSRSLPTPEAPAWTQELRAAVPDDEVRNEQTTPISSQPQVEDAPWVHSLRESVPQDRSETSSEDEDVGVQPKSMSSDEPEADTEIEMETQAESESEPEMILEDSTPTKSEIEPLETMGEDEENPENQSARLTWARSHMARGDVKAACQQYELILNEAPELVGQVISDLEKRLAEGNTPPLLHRLLGDAYLKDGQLDKALDAYRTPLDEI
jgi:tetratricopeptide (TPR) repeat protein